MNPLQNPLLTANMGRWAEVYFTTPPEQRAEAIAELIRQLERESGTPAKVEAPAAMDASAGAIEQEVLQSTLPKDSSSPAEISAGESSLLCVGCGHENPPDQRFCGMCGVQLQTTASSDGQIAGTDAESGSYEAGSGSHEAGSFLGLSHAYHDEPTVEHRMPEATPEPAGRMPDGDLLGFATVQPSVPYRYRLYLGAALMILLCTLIYMSWRGKGAFSGSQLTSTGVPYTQPAPAPSQAPAVSPAEAPKDTLATTKQEASPPAANKAAASKSPPPASQEQSPVPQEQAPAPESTNTATGRENTAQAEAPPEERSATFPSGAAVDTGQQELATAQQYLTDGPARNSVEAAFWLWKAVAKGNVAATVTLSDLYLRGDGVSKSCDQARLLLDAAARKGDKGAAERLRHLPAFGCQ